MDSSPAQSTVRGRPDWRARILAAPCTRAKVSAGRDRFVRVEVNHDLCEGHGKCEMSAPEVFELRDDDLSYVKLDPVPVELEEKVQRAFRLCPRQAVRILPDA